LYLGCIGQKGLPGTKLEPGLEAEIAAQWPPQSLALRQSRFQLENKL
jgi:hypothetical protein